MAKSWNLLWFAIWSCQSQTHNYIVICFWVEDYSTRCSHFMVHFEFIHSMILRIVRRMEPYYCWKQMETIFWYLDSFFFVFSYGTLEFIGDNFLILRIYICQFLFVNLYSSMVFSSYGSHEEEPLRLGNLYPLPLRGQSLFFY